MCQAAGQIKENSSSLTDTQSSVGTLLHYPGQGQPPFVPKIVTICKMISSITCNRWCKQGLLISYLHFCTSSISWMDTVLLYTGIPFGVSRLVASSKSPLSPEHYFQFLRLCLSFYDSSLNSCLTW